MTITRHGADMGNVNYLRGATFDCWGERGAGEIFLNNTESKHYFLASSEIKDVSWVSAIVLPEQYPQESPIPFSNSNPLAN